MISQDELIAAFLQREDDEFWAHWDAVAARHADAPLDELLAHMQWIGERVRRPNYRGCPQINVSAEFPDQDHPSRHVARAHMVALRERLAGIANKLGMAQPDDLATQLAVLVNGAFVSMELLEGEPADRLLAAAAKALVDAASGPS